MGIPTGRAAIWPYAASRATCGRACDRMRMKAGEAMDAKANLKAKLPSRHVTEGPERAPHRAFYYAMGLTRQQIHQPFVGVATCWNEAAPCNIALMRQAQAV